MKDKFKRRDRKPRALCRYCVPQEESGRKKCAHCHGYRLPSRREARRKRKSSPTEVA